MPTTFDLQGRTAIVTGAAQGIGLAISQRFATDGATVVMVDFNAETLAAAADVIPRAIPIACDVADSAAVAEAVTRARHETGRLDIVVNNAGIVRDRMLWKLTDDDWNAVIAVHLTGTFNFIRAATPVMREAGYGRIVNVTSYTGMHGNIGQLNYAAAKGGIIAVTKGAAKELSRFGITVNAISPNAATPMVAGIPDDKREAIAKTVPVGRWGQPEEMAYGVAFLCTAEAAYITGVVLPVDGGLAM